MANILEEIVAYKKEEVERFRKELSQVYLESRVEILRGKKVPSLASALKESPTGIIAEYKRKSPSKGWINKEAKANVIPKSYQENGATAISILTDSHFFGGTNAFIREAQLSGVNIPVLYKNFIVNEYQIYQARLAGASAILLIAACLTTEECSRFIALAHDLEMEVMLEIHKEEELYYSELGADLYGINNRDLETFEVNVDTSYRLAPMLPEGSVKVCESGINAPSLIQPLRQAGFNGFLIGEHFMKQPDPGFSLKTFISQIR